MPPAPKFEPKPDYTRLYSDTSTLVIAEKADGNAYYSELGKKVLDKSLQALGSKGEVAAWIGEHHAFFVVTLAKEDKALFEARAKALRELGYLPLSVTIKTFEEVDAEKAREEEAVAQYEARQTWSPMRRALHRANEWWKKRTSASAHK